MSFNTDATSGLQDEANVSNLFMKMGYFTRPHIQIFPNDTTQQVSDIDVYAIKFDQHLNRHTVLIEVKKSANKMIDLFKLYGFKTYYGDPETYFITDRIPDNFLDIAKNLGIKTMSFKKLRQITQSEQKEIGEEFTSRDIISTEQFLRTIRDNFNRDLYWQYHYLWLERNPYVKFFHLQKIFSKTNGNSNVEVLWFRKEIFIQAFLTHLEIASDCIGIDVDKIDAHIENEFYNMGTSKEGKLKIKEGVDALLDLIKKITKEDKKELPVLEIVPKYIKNLAFLVKRTIDNARYVNQYLKINDSIYRHGLHGKEMNVEMLTKIKAEEKELKNSNDIILRILHDGPIMSDFNSYV